MFGLGGSCIKRGLKSVSLCIRPFTFSFAYIRKILCLVAYTSVVRQFIMEYGNFV